MNFSGQVRKMISQNAQPIKYYLNLSGNLLFMNELFHKRISIKLTGYQCISCGLNKPIYRMGFCKDCFFTSPYASETIIRPELSKAHLGIEERDLAVEKEIQLVPHIVYLSYTSEVKIGVTRKGQVPVRWIDQGALQALPVARTDNRYEAGVIEVEMKNYLADKTNYRQMLTTTKVDADLLRVRSAIKDKFPEDSKKYYIPDGDLWNFVYPYEVPSKIKVFTLDKQSEFTGILKGIKGQYLEFDDGNFINVRNHAGYVVDLKIE